MNYYYRVLIPCNWVFSEYAEMFNNKIDDFESKNLKF